MAVQRVTVLDYGPGYVRVHSRNTRHCHQCSLKTGCGQQLLSGVLFSNTNNPLELPLAQERLGNVQAGDSLELSIYEGRLMILSLLQYGLPVMCMLVATALASSSWAGDGRVIFSAISALGFGLLLVRRITRTMNPSELLEMRSSQYQPGN
jgi:positive regulator of sigma E activity